MDSNPVIAYQEGFEDGVRKTKKGQDTQAFLDQAMIAAMQGLLAYGGEATTDRLNDLAQYCTRQSKVLLEERNKMIGGGK